MESVGVSSEGRVEEYENVRDGEEGAEEKRLGNGGKQRHTYFVGRGVDIVCRSFHASIVSIRALCAGFVGGAKLYIIGVKVLANAEKRKHSNQ